MGGGAEAFDIKFFQTFWPKTLPEILLHKFAWPFNLKYCLPFLTCVNLKIPAAFLKGRKCYKNCSTVIKQYNSSGHCSIVVKLYHLRNREKLSFISMGTPVLWNITCTGFFVWSYKYHFSLRIVVCLPQSCVFYSLWRRKVNLRIFVSFVSGR